MPSDWSVEGALAAAPHWLEGSPRAPSSPAEAASEDPIVPTGKRIKPAVQ